MPLNTSVVPLDLYGLLAIVPLDLYGLFAIGMLVFAMGLFRWKKLRRIEARLNRLRGEVNKLNQLESRRFFVALNSGKNGAADIERAEPSNSSIVPEIVDIHSMGALSLAVADSADVSRDGDHSAK